MRRACGLRKEDEQPAYVVRYSFTFLYVLVANVPKFRRSSSEEAAASFVVPLSVTVRDNALYTDTDSASHSASNQNASNHSARHSASVSLTSSKLPPFACRSAGSGDASATGTRLMDVSSVVGGTQD